MSHDVLGAHDAGLGSVWLDRNEAGDPDPRPGYRIGSLRELLPEP
jgi:FMN phosphatase YigB (HAD superfamily)